MCGPHTLMSLVHLPTRGTCWGVRTWQAYWNIMTCCFWSCGTHDCCVVLFVRLLLVHFLSLQLPDIEDPFIRSRLLKPSRKDLALTLQGNTDHGARHHCRLADYARPDLARGVLTGPSTSSCGSTPPPPVNKRTETTGNITFSLEQCDKLTEYWFQTVRQVGSVVHNATNWSSSFGSCKQIRFKLHP